MPRKRQVPRVIRPYLTTSEVLNLSETSRKVLRSCVDAGIVVPRRSVDDARYDQYTFAQTQDLRLVQALRRSDTPMQDIARLSCEEGQLLDAAYLGSAAGIRNNRRMLKSIVHLRRQIKRFAPVGKRNGYYLRYLPERWFALLPTAQNLPELLDADIFTNRLIALKSVVDVVGWSQSMTSSVIVSYAADDTSSTTYVGIELASPPVPFITEGRAVDGGCYRAVDESFCPCDPASCPECARFGRTPTDAETALWKTISITGQTIDRTVMADSLKEPYDQGVWSNCTQTRPLRSPSAVRPQLMPHEVRLPMGTTACTLPAGVYLCRQNDYPQRNMALQRMLGVIETIPHGAPRNQALERALTADVGRAHEAQRDKAHPGPFVEPFAAPRDKSNPAMFGWFLPLEDSDLRELRLPLDMALPPEDGFCLVHGDIPAPSALECDERQELQVLIDASAFIERMPAQVQAQAAENAQ